MESDFGPDFTQESFLCEEYISELLVTDMWSDHGSSIDELIQEYLDEIPVAAEFKLEKWQDDPAAMAFFKEWLPKRYHYASEELYAELAHVLVGYPRLYEIHRCIRGNMATVMKCTLGSFDIGKYWSVNKTIPYGAKDDPLLPIEITVTGTVKHEDIDWIGTMCSRMDFSHGDIEAEIQLLPGKYPTFKSVSYRNITQENPTDENY